MSDHTSVKQPMQITGRMVFIGFVVFFGIIAAVNGVFMYMALDTWPGLTTQDAYKKGLNYNETLKSQEAQRALGWGIEIELVDGKTLKVQVNEKNNAPLSGLDVQAVIARPLGDETSTLVRFKEIMPGNYATEFLAAQGRWKINLMVKGAEGEVSETHHEILVQP